MKRGAIVKSDSRLITVWFPNAVLPSIDAAVRIEDTDRAKFIRKAVREKLSRIGLNYQESK